MKQEKISRSRGGVAPKKMVGVMIGQAQEKTRPRIEHETLKAKNDLQLIRIEQLCAKQSRRYYYQLGL